MENELTMYEGKQAVVKPRGVNYSITSPTTGNNVTLQRDIDFGMLPKLKRPTLFKAGAEKIINTYGLLQHYVVESKYEEFGENPLFFYMVRCDLVKVSNDGKEYVFTSGLGSANSRERSNGFNGAYDSANSVLKKACKRAMVAAAINISGISGAFFQDLEDTDFVEGGYKSITETQDPESRITAKQVKRLFAIANNAGINANKAKERLAIMGYTKAGEIIQAVYDEVCEKIALEDGAFNDAVKVR